MKKNNASILALMGGKKHIQKEMTHYNSIGDEEVLAVKEVVESGILSKFVGTWGDDFYHFLRGASQCRPLT